MAGLTPRERVLRALNHEEVDRVPIDFGSSFASTITLPAYERLKDRLAVKHESRLMRLTSQTVVVDEEVLRHFNVDTRALLLGSPERSAEHWNPDGTYVDEWGITWRRPEGGFYYDMVKSPLAGPISLEDIERYPWPDPHAPGRLYGLRERAEELHNAGYFTILNFPLGFIHMTQFLRGFEDWFSDLLLNPELAGALMDKVIDINLGIGGDALKVVGDLVDAVFVADDVAMQNGLMMSAELYRRLIKPRQKRVYDYIKAHSRAKIIYHSCGAVEPLINDFIEIGVDALNPVQVSAKGMDTARLKELYGDRITFWGGGCDTQHVLPHGRPEDVRAEVRRRVKDLAPGGGFVFCAVHNIQADVPAENICAMFEAAQEYGRYPYVMVDSLRVDNLSRLSRTGTGCD